MGRKRKVDKGLGSFKLKNHVTPRSRQIQGELSGKFGLQINDLIRAMMGDEKATKSLGEQARQGRLMSEFAPKVAERAKEVINGTQAFNEAVGQINIASGQSSTAIDRIADSAELANVQWIDARTLRFIDKDNQDKLQRLKTENSKAYLKMKGMIDYAMASIDGDYQLLSLELRPEMRQAQIDESHTIEMANYNLEMGNNARSDFKPKKNYQPKNMMQQIKDVVFGF